MTAAKSSGSSLVRMGARFRAPVVIEEFPPEVPFGFLAKVLPTTEPIELRFEVHRIAPDQSLRLLDSLRAATSAELADSNGRDLSRIEAERDAVEDLGRSVAARGQELWRLGLVFVAEGASRARAEAVRARLIERLTSLGFRVRLPRFSAPEALAPPDAVTPEQRPRGYWHTLPTDALGAMFPGGDETIVEDGGVLVGLALADASPVFLDRWSRASYSWGIFGTTGAGKSFTAALLLLRTLWLHPATEVVVLDPLGEFGGLVRALGGTEVRIGDPSQGRLNPLDPATVGGDRREKAGRVAAMLRALFPSLRDEEAARLDAATSRLFDRGPAVPTFSDLHREVEQDGARDDRLLGLLEVFRTGSLRGVDGPTTLSVEAPLVELDLSGIPEEAMPFHLAYLLDWVYGRLRDRPGRKLVLLDEAHLLARHPGMAGFLDSVVRHVRHFDAGFLVLSQHPEDFLASESGRSVLRNLAATACLRLPGISEASRAFFGLTEAEAEWLTRSRLPAECGYAESLWRVGPWHLPLAIIASTPEHTFLTRVLGAR